MAAYHSGRLIDHVPLRVADLDRSRVFYRAVLAAIGLGDAIREGDGYFSADELWIDAADSPHRPFSRVHLAFKATDRAAVHAFHRAALAAGGRDNGRPLSVTTTLGTMPPSHSTPTATTWKRSSTGLVDSSDCDLQANELARTGGRIARIVGCR